MSEIRLFLRRDGLLTDSECPWAWLDDAGRVARSGTRLDDLPPARHCRLVLAGDMVLAVRGQVPNLAARKLAPLLPVAAEAATLSAAEQLHAVLSGRGVQSEALLLVADRAWLARILAALRQHGLRPESALPEYLLLPWNDGEWSVLWNEDGPLVRFGRHHGAALDCGEPPAGLRLALAQEGPPRRLRIHPGNALVAPEPARWSEALGVPVETARPFDWRSAPWPDQPHLLQGDFAPSRNGAERAALLRTALKGAAVLAAIHLAGTGLDWASLQREQRALQSEMHKLAQQCLPAHAAVVDPPWQVANQLATMRVAAGASAPDGFLVLLRRVGQAWPATGAAQVRALAFEAGVVTLTLAGADERWLAELKSAAAASGLTLESAAGEGGTQRLLLRQGSGKEMGKDGQHGR